MMRLILDTNILLSALLSPASVPAKLLDTWERRAFTLVGCEALITELLDVSARPYFRARLRVGTAESLAAGIRDLSFFCRNLAEVSQARFVVTGDKVLLDMKSHKGTRIVSPAAMRGILVEFESSQ